MLSALIMPALVGKAFRYAVREDDFLQVFGAGVFIVIVGTISFALGEDPNLVLDHRWIKVFAVLYQLVGIGILVEILRRLGMAFVHVRAEEKRAGA